MDFPGSCPLGQCHGRSLSHGHALDPSLMAFLGDTLRPSSSSCPMAIAGILLQPSQQSPGQSSSSDQEPQQGLERDIPVSSPLSSLQINSYPLVAPQHLSAAPPDIPHPCHVHCCPHFHAQPHHDMSSMGTQPPPWQGYHHATTALLHPGDRGKAPGTLTSREEAALLVTSR